MADVTGGVSELADKERAGCMVVLAFSLGVVITAGSIFLTKAKSTGVSAEEVQDMIAAAPYLTEGMVVNLIDERAPIHARAAAGNQSKVQWFNGLVTYSPDAERVSVLEAQIGWDPETGGLKARKVTMKKPEPKAEMPAEEPVVEEVK